MFKGGQNFKGRGVKGTEKQRHRERKPLFVQKSGNRVLGGDTDMSTSY